MASPTFERPTAETTPRTGFPPLETSPYAVPVRAHTRRWWYSDGLWLDQGQTGGVVGFVWTHWLADRGVAVPGAELDEEYARQLQFAAQRLMGGPEGLEYGAFIDAGARVLASRGLIEQCYTFAGVGSVVDALLERGPVVAGISWQQEMFETHVVDGWTLCRAKPGGTIVGGQAVLLNGIAPDLTIGGVTGFVRLKNTYGRGWGDNGQVLVSIADLEATMELDTLLLPIPAARVTTTPRTRRCRPRSGRPGSRKT